MLKVQDERDQILVAKVYEATQDHVFDFWDELGREQRRSLLDQIERIDFQQLQRLDRLRGETSKLTRLPQVPVLEPPPAIELPRTEEDRERRAEAEKTGWAALEAGRVACFVAAGGLGTRLGWEHPKGTYAVGPVTGKSLFQLFSEQIAAIQRHARHEVLWFIMTSSTNHAETEAFFAKHAFFGLASPQVRFIEQRDMPVVDFRGKLLLESKHAIAVSPDGHGGALRALRESGSLDEMRRRSIDYLFYFQVDNPLCRIADPVFVGFHEMERAEMSTKWVKKIDPAEKVGLVVAKDKKLTVVEYSEIDDQNRLAREPSGDLRFRCGNTAIHCFSRSFLERVSQTPLTPHVARKAVAFVDRKGELQKPEAPNAIKFETFIFDILGLASSHVALEVARADEFEPLKNASGPYSPESVRAAISSLHARWLEQAGVAIPKNKKGEPEGRYEVSPLTALSADELRKKLAGGSMPSVKKGELSL